MKDWSNLARVVFRRTYSRRDSGTLENWDQTVERTIAGNVRGKNVPESEVKELIRLAKERKAGPAGRGYWFSGAPSHAKIGGAALNNCWFLTSENWENFVIAQDLLMLGGGVGLSVEHQFTSKLPKVRKDVVITHKATKDADFIVPDSREGWCELTRRVLESYLVTGRSFSFSTVCVRGYGEAIVGFGGTASGPLPLVKFIETLCGVFNPRAGKHVRPIDAADIITATGELVVSGNVRRSAILVIGDAWDKEYLKAKRWDLGDVPTHRSCANYSIMGSDTEDFHPLFWKTYEQGEAFGIINRPNIQKYGRMGELKPDAAIGMNPCVPAGTDILTEHGYLPIETRVGLTTKIWNGFEWSEVTPRITGYNQPLVKVNLSNGLSLICTPAHEFALAEGYTGRMYKVAARDLVAGDKLIKHKFPVLPGDVDEPTAYAQGFISADGMNDCDHIYIYGTKENCIPYLFPKYSTWEEGNNRWRTKMGFKPLSKTFVPTVDWSIDSRLDWFAGLLDGDGTVLKEGGAQIASVDKTFLLNTQKMLTTLGVPSKVTFGREACEKMMPDGKGGHALYDCQEVWRLLVGAVEMQELVSLGLITHRTNYVGFKPQRNAGQFIRVTSVEDAGVAEVVYCFTEHKRHLGCFDGIVTGQCAEATLENGEPCNLVEQALNNFDDEDEFIKSSRWMLRYAKRVTLEHYHHKVSADVIARNRRVGIGITGCLASPLFNPDTLDRAYAAIQDEDEKYSKELGVPRSKRTTVVKPSGTMSKVLDCMGYEGIHAAYSRYFIQRIRFASNDALIPKLRAAGHYIEPQVRFDGSNDPQTLVADFYVASPEGYPVADENWDTWKQLDVLKMAQKHWADQAVSVTVYYKREDIPQLKTWLAENLQYLKSISFLCHSDHGFKQAPKEAISQEKYEKMSAKIRPLNLEDIGEGDLIADVECSGGVCPVR